MTPERSEKLARVMAKRQENITVVLEHVEDPRNIAAIMRSCDAVGIQDIHLIHPPQARPRNWGFLSARSAEKWVTLHHYNEAETCIAELLQQQFILLTTHLGADSVPLHEVDFTRKVALVFGNERNGVSEQIRNRAQGNFNVPQVGMIQSLNISVACAVSIYEAYRQKMLAGHYNTPGMHAARRETLLQQWSIKQ
ncbi:TrmH family RNA methyltransferase [Deminuibacter soli]|uniref:tRNA (guanosine(18)-2'-O)-methyltransferase n=1 Tax=Deminuibacter soli TaxID=2291815 RepID=A0A3E1NJU2_9BACT|nr:RNA methyltransferase [Deminuibacter soli]RFM28058.1 RNA methyltransferase [Deminuibacter soli]